MHERLQEAKVPVAKAQQVAGTVSKEDTVEIPVALPAMTRTTPHSTEKNWELKTMSSGSNKIKTPDSGKRGRGQPTKAKNNNLDTDMTYSERSSDNEQDSSNGNDNDYRAVVESKSKCRDPVMPLAQPAATSGS